ncbi:MAG: SpoIIE family protein phosphatase [Bacteroidales bacterium]|nr:SpoIIE family protein phosphatase [Bacteroidales bacterium]
MYLIDNDLVEDDNEKYDLLCRVITKTEDAETKIRYCDLAIELAGKLDILPAVPYIGKGEAYLDSGKYALAVESFMKAAGYCKTNNDQVNLGRAYTLIAETYNRQGNYENAKLYLQDAIDLFEQEKDSFRLSYALHNLGYLNCSMGQYDTALVLFELTGKLFKKSNNTFAYYCSLGNSGLAYSRLSDYDKAEEALLQAIDTLSSLGDVYYVPEFMIEYANILMHKGEIEPAIDYAYRAQTITDDPEYEGNAAHLLALIYASTGRFDSAYHYQSLFIVANDSLKNVESVQKMSKLRADFEIAQKQAEVDVLEKNKLIHNIIIIGLGIILLLAIGLVTLYYTSLKRSKKLTAALEERRLMLEKQSSELKEKNEKIVRANEELQKLYEITNSQKEEIISSINYAQRIQQAILPPEAYITELITENFIIYKPKDIVSGDFYWIKQINQYIILACADCTGHGVPGALMSMLGISYLNEIVRRKEVTQANQVLNELRSVIKHSLRQTGKTGKSRDGIDMALCVIDTDKHIMQYSGAFNPLYFISNSGVKPVLKEIKADTMPVGVHFSSDKAFTNHEIQLQIGDTFYITTDGFIDQDGGDSGSRLGTDRFKKLLLDICDQPMYEQREILEQTLGEWMGEHPQRDDILVIGARV